MRHYGAPSRLQDWSYSFYVALFFALREAGQACAVWALEKFSLIENRYAKIPFEVWKDLSEDKDITKYRTWKNVFTQGVVPFVYPVNPFRLNERLVIQQSDFLCTGDISKPFEENLAAMLPEDKGQNNFKLYKYEIDFSGKERQKALLHLHRMNINEATLFPGLGGFARSLKHLLTSPKNLLKPPN